jgi:hypothetical protein
MRWIFDILAGSTTPQMLIYAAVLVVLDIICAMCFDHVVGTRANQ